MDEGETAAERKRRLGALGMGGGDDSSPESDSDAEEGGDPLETGRGTQGGARAKAEASSPQASGAARKAPGIRFAEQPRIPTKDERMQEDRDVAEAASGGKKGLGMLKWKK